MLICVLAGGMVCAVGCVLVVRANKDADQTIKRIVKEANECRSYQPPKWAEELKTEAKTQRALANGLSRKWARRAVRSYRSLYRRRRP